MERYLFSAAAVKKQCKKEIHTQFLSDANSHFLTET